MEQVPRSLPICHAGSIGRQLSTGNHSLDARPMSELCAIVRLALGQEIRVCSDPRCSPRGVQNREYQRFPVDVCVRNDWPSSKRLALFPAGGDRDALQDPQRVQAQRLLGPCDSLDPKVCFNICKRRMEHLPERTPDLGWLSRGFGQAIVGKALLPSFNPPSKRNCSMGCGSGTPRQFYWTTPT